MVIMRRDKEDTPVEDIQEIGFDTVMVDGAVQSEKLYFINAVGVDSYNATDEALTGAAERWEKTAKTLRDYLEYNRENDTVLWPKSSEDADTLKGKRLMNGQAESEDVARIGKFKLNSTNRQVYAIPVRMKKMNLPQPIWFTCDWPEFRIRGNDWKTLGNFDNTTFRYHFSPLDDIAREMLDTNA